MRKVLNLNVLSSAVLMAVATGALAAPPALQGWNPTFGATTPAGGSSIGGYESLCGTGYSCTPTAGGSGFLQLSVIDNATQENYIVTVIADQNTATPGFIDKSMVKISTTNSDPANQSGIVAYQTITQDGRSTTGGAGELFKSSTTIDSTQTSTTDPNSKMSIVNINQAVIGYGGVTGTDPEKNPGGKDFVTGFWYEARNDANGATIGKKMEIDQFAGLQDRAGSAGSANDMQAFTLRDISGSYLAAAGSIALPNPSSVSGTGALPASATVAWDANKGVKAIWIGQNVASVSNSAGGLPGGSFSYLAFEDTQAGGEWATRAGFGAVGNATAATPWDTAFNVRGQTTAPCLQNPGGLSGGVVCTTAPVR